MPEAVNFTTVSYRTQPLVQLSPEGAGSAGQHMIPNAPQMAPGGRYQDPDLDAEQSRRISPEVDIPCASRPSGEAFLVPSSCKSICKNYSDLLIGGDQVLPLSGSVGDLVAGYSSDFTDGPFLQSCEIPPALESPHGSLECPQQPRGDSARWKRGSGRERSIQLHGGRPLSNSQLNEYLEQKLLDLYRQHMVDSMLQEGSPSAILASELILTSVDQITQQLSREQNLEAARAKDMVISCLLRVASGLPSGEISTPQLQISEDVM
ncbi:protein CXorf21 [Megalops cyprinoides]|uniref:protein CXorf21 n=1 Tax=Megalops cyprinoides TaxID=118141 RepID=UPI001864D009|nr:protein CXorf21 [Megalops cyprinoides]